MPEAEVKNPEVTEKPKCLRCGAEHTVSNLGHWLKGWWTCADLQYPVGRRRVRLDAMSHELNEFNKRAQ